MRKPSIDVSASDSLIKVYGEANPNKTDENLLDVEANTQIINVRNRSSASQLSAKTINGLSSSGYGPPGQKFETESITEVQAIPDHNVGNVYGEDSSDTEAVSTEALSTNIEQAVLLNKAAASTTVRSKDFRKRIGITESDTASTETISEPSEASIDSQEGNIASSTSGSERTHDVSTEKLKITSIGNEIIGMSTIEDVRIGETESISKVPKNEGTEETEVQKTLNTVTPSQSVTESFTKDSIKLMKTNTGDFEYELASETVKMQSTAEKSHSSTSGNLPDSYKLTVTSDLGKTAYSTTSSTVTGKEKNDTGRKETYGNGSKPDSNTKEIHSSQQIITETKVSGDAHQDQENITRTETEMNTDMLSILTTRLWRTVTSTTPTHIAKGNVISKTVNSAAIEPSEIVTNNKAGLPALNKKSSSQLSESVEQATTLLRTSTENSLVSERTTMPLENTVDESKDLESSTEPSTRVNGTTESSKETSLMSAEQLSEYSTVMPKSAFRKETTELQRINEEVETTDTEKAHVEEKVMSDDTSAISGGVSAGSGSTEYGSVELIRASESASESKEDKAESEISKSDERLGLAEYGETSPSEQISSEAGPGEHVSSIEGPEVISAETPEETTQPNELQTMMISEETKASEPNVKGVEIENTTMTSAKQTISSEAVMPKEVIRSDEQSSSYKQLSATTTVSYHESNKELSPKQATTDRKEVREYGVPISNEGITTSEADITIEKVVNVTPNTLQDENHAKDIRINPANFGYGGKAITERGYVGSSTIDSLLNSISSTKLIEEATENMMESSGEVVSTNEGDRSTRGYNATGSLLNYSTTEKTTNQLSESDEKLEIAESTSVATPENSERTTSLTSLISENTGSEITANTVAKRGKMTETPISRTVLSQEESNKIKMDMNDFGYGDRLDETTEAQLISHTEDYTTFITVPESTLTTRELQVTDETTAESIQQSLATEVSQEIEMASTTETVETSQQYHTKVDGAEISSNSNNETVNISETHRSTVSKVSRETTESTLLHVITNAIETPISYDVNEEAPKVIAMTKVIKKGPSKLAGSIIASTKGTKEKEEEETGDTETTKGFEDESEETSEVRNEMDSTSSETSLASSESPEITTAEENTESQFSAKNLPNQEPVGLEDSGYGNANELSEFISQSGAQSVTTTIVKLPNNLVETSANSELSASSECPNSQASVESESTSSEEFTGTSPSAISNALTDSFTATQKILTMHGEIITDKKIIPNNIPISAKDFGYGDEAVELSTRSLPSGAAVISEGMVFHFPEYSILPLIIYKK